jgi:hypothetical protein
MQLKVVLDLQRPDFSRHKINMMQKYLLLRIFAIPMYIWFKYITIRKIWLTDRIRRKKRQSVATVLRDGNIQQEQGEWVMRPIMKPRTSGHKFKPQSCKKKAA